MTGWYLDGNGVSKLEVIVDGVVTGTAVCGDLRPDVKNVYPSYNNGASGFHYVLDTKALLNGSHTINIRETGKDGSQRLMMTVGRGFSVRN